MTIKLSGIDRLIIIDKVMPSKGSRLDMIAANEIIDKIKIPTDEFDELGLKEDNNRLSWDEKIAKEKEYEFNDKHIALLKRRLDELDKANEWSREMLPTFMKIESMLSKNE